MKQTPPALITAKLLGAVCLVAISLTAFWPGLHGNYIFDDLPNLIQTDHWKVTTTDRSEWAAAIWNGRSSEIGRPLAMFSFAVNHYFTGMDPWPMKATNLAFHCVNSLLVWALCTRIFSLAPTAPTRLGGVAALFVAAAWTLHPLQVSTVLYIVQRMEIVSHTFVLLALLAYLRARESQLVGKRSIPWFAACAGSSVVALGFKETAILVPAYTLLVEVIFLGFTGAAGQPCRRLKYSYLLLIGLGVVAYLAWIVPHYAASTAWQFRDYDLWDRVLTQPAILLMYLAQIIFPNPESLLFYYDHLAFSRELFSPAWIAASSLAVSALVVACLRLKGEQPLIGFGLLFFLASHALTSNVVPLELAFEHRNYAGLMGVLLAIVGLVNLLGRTWERKTKVMLSGLTIAFLFAVTHLQSLTWGDRLNLAMTLAARNPESARASYGLAVELQIASGGNSQHPLWSLALKQMRDVSALEHGSPLGEQGEIIMLANAGRQAPAGTWSRLRSKLTQRELNADDSSVLQALLNCSLKEECSLEDEQLHRTFSEALTSNPDSADVRVLFATFALHRLRDPQLATSLLSAALERDPENASIRMALLRTRLATGWRDDDQIRSELQEIQRHDQEGQFDAAIVELADWIQAPD